MWYGSFKWSISDAKLDGKLYQFFYNGFHIIFLNIQQLEIKINK